MPGCIYRLDDPTNLEVRYVGKTVSLEKRLKQHISESTCEASFNEDKKAWIRGLGAKQLQPLMYKMEEVASSRVDKIREKIWIRRYFNRGAGLLNVQDAVTHEDILYCYPPKYWSSVRTRLKKVQPAAIYKQNSYCIKELFDSLPVTITQAASILDVPEYGLIRFIEGVPVPEDRANLFLLFLSWAHKRSMYPTNVRGVHIRDLYPLPPGTRI